MTLLPASALADIALDLSLNPKLVLSGTNTATSNDSHGGGINCIGTILVSGCAVAAKRW